ncbi:MAG TPA: hypothetical protein VFI23_02570 [Rhizomicrobium sp.]|nr:hypothetical protein [Rhizomicrobium sp.]
MSEFLALTSALIGHFERDQAELPAALQKRVTEMFLVAWDRLSPGQRREVALQSDFENDPACQPDMQRMFELYAEIQEAKDAKCNGVGDLDIRDRRITERELEIANIDARLVREAFARWNLPPEFVGPVPTSPTGRRRIQPQRARALSILSQLFTGNIPSQPDLPNKELVFRVNQQLRQGETPLSKDTILRAAGRSN